MLNTIDLIQNKAVILQPQILQTFQNENYTVCLSEKN